MHSICSNFLHIAFFVISRPCASFGVGCCPTGGYIDDNYNALLDLDGVEESVVGVVAIGEK